MKQIWVTSDWHFCHQREFLWQPRGFNSVYEMNKAIVERHNAVVGPDEDVYCLGDCMLNDNEEGLRLIKQLKGRIHIIRGNHDSDARLELYRNCYNVVEVCDAKFLRYGKYHFFLSHYPCISSNHDDDKPLERRTVGLCGHTHTKNKFCDMDKGLIFHCEMDTNDCRPWLLNDIITELENYKGE